MGEQLRQAIRSTIAPQDVYAAMRSAWDPLVGQPAKRSQLLVLLAQQAFETGWWHYCWCWNLGNAKHVAGDGRDYCMVRLNEVIGGKVAWLDPPNPATWLRAFTSLEAGVVDYLTLMRGQFGYAWPSVESGDVGAFCHALKARDYYSDDEHHYTANVIGCYHMLDLAMPQDELPTQPELVGAPAMALPEDEQDTPPPDAA